MGPSVPAREDPDIAESVPVPDATCQTREAASSQLIARLLRNCDALQEDLVSPSANEC